MLRLCHGLNRYSVDLDFYFIKKIDLDKFNKRFIDCISRRFQITDAAVKHFTLLYEFRSKNHPRRLKIEIRKQLKPLKYEEVIAFSANSTQQVLLKALTLEQMMKNKIEAALNRKEPRDCFDIEFLLRRGVKIDINDKTKKQLKDRASGFTKKDIAAALSPLLEISDRNYYYKNGFKFLVSQIGWLVPF